MRQIAFVVVLSLSFVIALAGTVSADEPVVIGQYGSMTGAGHFRHLHR